MRILIGSYVVKSDAENIWLEKKGVNADPKSKNVGKETWTRCSGYHRTLDAALDSMFQKEIRCSDAKNISELRGQIEEIKLVISHIRDGIKLDDKEIRSRTDELEGGNE